MQRNAYDRPSQEYLSDCPPPLCSALFRSLVLAERHAGSPLRRRVRGIPAGALPLISGIGCTPPSALRWAISVSLVSPELPFLSSPSGNAASSSVVAALTCRPIGGGSSSSSYPSTSRSQHRGTAHNDHLQARTASIQWHIRRHPRAALVAQD